MRISDSFQLLALGGLVLAVGSCQQEQPAAPPRVEAITSLDPKVRIVRDTALFNKVMGSPTPPDSIP